MPRTKPKQPIEAVRAARFPSDFDPQVRSVLSKLQDPSFFLFGFFVSWASFKASDEVKLHDAASYKWQTEHDRIYLEFG